MQHQEISAEQAGEIFLILKEDCGWLADSHDEGAFIRAICHDEHICHEYRFMGALGFGGKLRNNGNRENLPHVDCYPEDETPERLAMIASANLRIAEVFA